MEETRPQLHNKKAFIEALQNYEISSYGRDILSRTPFVALSGVAGGGRNTIIRYLVERHNYIFAVSDTTRPPKLRDGKMEVNGVNYYFRSEEEMLGDIKAGLFIEAEVIHNQQVSGISVREIERTLATGRIPISDIEYGGIKNIIKAKPDAVIIGLVPPSYDEWIRRLYNREPLHDQEFLNRLTTAEKVLENMLTNDYFKLVVNDSTDGCIKDIREIVEHDNYSPAKAAEARGIVTHLLYDVRQQLVLLANS